MTHSNAIAFDIEVLAFWYQQAQWQRAAFDTYVAYLG